MYNLFACLYVYHFYIESYKARKGVRIGYLGRCRLSDMGHRN